ncbi:MAG TPA: signal peptidase I [Patescibacteria group bacterium]|nr:signal peptidase I [Patescibacteria group bacterium]
MEFHSNYPGTPPPLQAHSPEPSVGAYIWDLVKIIGSAMILVFGIIRPFIAEPFIVSGSSMVPNFHDREYLIIEKLTYRFSEVRRGDALVLRYPKHPNEYYIKRVIALPGEKVRFEGGKVVIYNTEHPNGVILEEPYLDPNLFTEGSQVLQTVGEGEFFVLGDNRGNSSDSRAWGMLPRADIVGKVWVRILPPRQFGVITTPDLQ